MVPRRRVTQKPIVIAGLRWPPEMWPMAVTITPNGEAVGERRWPSRPMLASPEARRYWSAQMEPAPMKTRANVPTNSASSFWARLYKRFSQERCGALRVRRSAVRRARFY